MAYTPHTYSTGDTLTAALLNANEQGTQAAAAAADTANAGLTSKVNSSTYTAGLAGKADLVSGVVPDAQLPTRLSTSGLNSAIDARGTANGWGSGGSGINAADTGYDIILLMGQSNMVGVNTDFDARTDPADGRVFTFDTAGNYASKIAGALDPLQHQGGSSGVGPGLSFARWYARTQPTNRVVLLVPVAQTGTPLVSTSAPTWNSTVSGSLYSTAVARAQAALAAAGANSRFAAVLWVQGETDGQNGVPAANYQTALDALIAKLRTDLSTPHLPFVIGSMMPEVIAGNASIQAIATVQAATPSRVAYTAYAAGPTGYVGDSGIHYLAAGQRILGRSMAAAYPSAVADSSPTPAPDTTAPTITSFTATPGNAQVALAWAGTDDVAITRWTVTRGGTSVYDGTATSKTDTGLTNSTAYTYTLTAYDAAGNTKTATASATPVATATAPGAPTGLTAGTPTAATVPLSWTAPASNGGSAITDYVVQYRVTGAGSWQTFADGTSTTTSATVTGLTASTGYDFQVAAVNSVGTGTYSATASASTAAASGGGGTGPALTTLRGTPTYTAGKFGNALSGGVLSNSGLGVTPTQGTVEVWVTLSTSSGNYVAIDGSSSASYFLGAKGGSVHTYMGDGSSIADGAWHHIAMTFSGGNCTGWLDGALLGTAAAPWDFATALYIGGLDGSGFDWPGKIDEVRFSDVIRYSAPFTPPTTPFTADANTIALYHLDS